MFWLFPANKDYRPVAKALEFYPGESFIEVAIEIIDDLYRPRMEGRETFAVVLHSPRNGRLDESSSKAIVGIEDLDLDSKTNTILLFVNLSQYDLETL